MREDHSTFFHLSEISYPSLYMSMQLMKICFWKDLPIAFHEYVIFAEIWVHIITLWVTTYLPSASHIGSWCWLGTNFFVHSKCASTRGGARLPAPLTPTTPCPQWSGEVCSIGALPKQWELLRQWAAALVQPSGFVMKILSDETEVNLFQAGS